MPPHTNSPPKRTIGIAAAGHFAVALLVLAAAVFAVVAWPRTPPTVRAMPPATAWAAWIFSLAYLAALFAWHFRLAKAAMLQSDFVDRRALFRALVSLPVVTTAAWLASLGLNAKALLLGLGDTVTALFAAGALSSLWLIAAPALTRSTSRGSTPKLPRDRLVLILAAACLLAGIGAASTLLWIQFGGAAPPA